MIPSSTAKVLLYACNLNCGIPVGRTR
jgi:hypothetical protein